MSLKARFVRKHWYLFLHFKCHSPNGLLSYFFYEISNPIPHIQSLRPVSFISSRYRYNIYTQITYTYTHHTDTRAFFISLKTLHNFILLPKRKLSFCLLVSFKESDFIPFKVAKYFSRIVVKIASFDTNNLWTRKHVFFFFSLASIRTTGNNILALLAHAYSCVAWTQCVTQNAIRAVKVTKHRLL